jgi:hypothetical protein
MCILCEEPFRSILIGLAALGAVSLFRMAQKGLKRFRSSPAVAADDAS